MRTSFDRFLFIGLKVKINPPVVKRDYYFTRAFQGTNGMVARCMGRDEPYLCYMSRFRTELSVTSAQVLIDHQSDIVTVGSCFSETIGQRLVANKFRVASNPFGTVYNPISIHRLLNCTLENRIPKTSDLQRSGDRWVHPDFHSRFSGNQETAVIDAIHQTIADTQQHLKANSTVLLTYGTAWVFESLETGHIVANCHKMPAQQFRQRLLSVDDIVSDFHLLQKRLLQHGVRQIILTVSPVRHVKSTLELNSVSKSVLRLACHRICSESKLVTYFPAYEIMMDDLRDYRFYASDMIHPSSIAEDYIWEKFSGAWFSKTTQDLIGQWTEVSKALHHRPFHPESATHRRFQQELRNKLIALSSRMDVAEKLRLLDIQINEPAP
jgi:hypothetical protein